MPKLNDLVTHDAINALLDAYQNVLTKRQQEMMAMYFRFNLSLQEIAKELKISRAAVSIAIKEATASLKKLEAQVGMVALKQTLTRLMEDPLLPASLKKKWRQWLNREDQR